MTFIACLNDDSRIKIIIITRTRIQVHYNVWLKDIFFFFLFFSLLDISDIIFFSLSFVYLFDCFLFVWYKIEILILGYFYFFFGYFNCQLSIAYERQRHCDCIFLFSSFFSCCNRQLVWLNRHESEINIYRPDWLKSFTENIYRHLPYTNK